MRRAEALDELVATIGRAFPIVRVRTDSSTQRSVGVEIAGLPVGEFRCATFGPYKVEGINLQLRIAGISTVEVPMFLDPPGQVCACVIASRGVGSGRRLHGAAADRAWCAG